MAATHIDEPSRTPSQEPVRRAPPERVVSTRDLLAGSQRIWIEHSAERYLLQITRSGKLILTK